MEAPPRVMTLSTPAQIFTPNAAEMVSELQVEMTWRAADPFAMRLRFIDGEHTVDWHADVDLFHEASADKGDSWQGEGDLRVRVVEMACYVLIHPKVADEEDVEPVQQIIVKLPAFDIVPWLLRLKVLQAIHLEGTAKLVSDELDLLLLSQEA